MPRGGRRPGSGRKPKSLALHRLHGTLRRDRHGEAATAAAVLPMPRTATEWRPSEAEVTALSPLAQTWLTATLNLYVLNAVEGQQVLECLRVLSRIDVLEQTEGMVAAGALVRERKLFLSMWTALRLEQ